MAEEWVVWVLLLGAAIYLAYLTRSFFKKHKCTICGSKNVEKIPKRWVTAPMSYRGGPITVTSQYKYRCLKCGNEWEDF
jgi:DNA-directed RNA polymerase subunit RPC12/RpoP